MRTKFWIVLFVLLGCLTACGEKKEPAAAGSGAVPTTGENIAAETPSPTETPSADPSGDALTPSLTPLPPGTLPEVDSLPKADDSSVGSKCTLRLLATERQSFAYYYDAKSGRERLVTVPVPPDEEYIFQGESYVLPPKAAPITVYETALGGIDGLRAALNGEIEATVLAVVNISYQEIDAAHCAIAFQEEPTDALQSVELNFGETASEGLGRFFGANSPEPYSKNEALWQLLPDGQYVMLWEAVKEEDDTRNPNMDEIFRRIYERFGLTELIFGAN
ncbi:MAG: hypothetical protein Q4C48_02155 [Lachnospiraceae bacterium]|nr:hypothetical protein [Lachnospiraceae bacterium]